ncbi:MAG: DinB family protein [Bacteroidota bacterium]|nr:DinB family protein [Bacteroidota bacterium]
MLKRTKGYILLTLLVITGLANQVPSDTLTSKERKFLINNLKDTKENLSKTVKGLSETQLNFKPGADKWSVKECVQHLAIAEENFWKMGEEALKQPANAENRKEIKMSDQDMINAMIDRSQKFQAPETFKPEQSKWKTSSEAMNAFKETRMRLIKYVKTTTEDIRNHVTKAPLGSIDVYQVFLITSAHTARHTKQIEEIKTDPAFPK